MLTVVWIAFIVTAIVLIVVLYWRYEVMVSHVTFSILPPYEIPEVIVMSGVMVENRGRAAASNVQIRVQYDPSDTAKISHMRIVGDDAYVIRSGGERHSHAVIRLREMDAGQKVFIYVSGSRAVTPQVQVTADQ